jgi:hypothetical protein
MGKLAERLSDARRSGVYRVETTEALEEAAGLNGFALERCALAEPAAIPAPAGSCRDGCVLLITGFEPLAHNGALKPLLGELEARAKGSREAGARYFAVFLDPSAVLSLPPLYNWQRQRGG